MLLEVDAKIFVESVEQSSSNELAKNSNLSKEKESIAGNEVLENKRNFSRQPPAQATRLTAVEQANPEINVEKGVN